MAKKFDLRLNRSALARVRKSPEVTAELGRRASRVASQANATSGTSGYKASTYQGRTRARATVITSDLDSTLDNARENTLIRSFDAAKGD